MSWSYEVVGPNGGAGGDAYKSVFNGTGKDPAATLAREAVQNSVDAVLDPTGRVRLDFKFTRLEGDERDRFFTNARLNEMVERQTKLGLISTNCLAQKDEPIELLFVEDYFTTGLEGDPTNPNSNLRKLLMDLGGSPKSKLTNDRTERGGITGRRPGGSYGFGKAAYSANSKIGVVFVFSKTRDERGEPLTVLMGAAYQAEHELFGCTYTGRGWLGKQVPIPNNPPRFDPFLGEEAERIARDLGFNRDNGDGTSILIVDTAIDPNKLIQGLEDNWWPRIDTGLLEVEVCTDDGQLLAPRPKSKRHLKPFIDAWGVARDKTPPESRERAQIEFRKKTITDPEERKVSIGKMGLISLQEDEDDYPLGEDYDELVNTIALIRSPLMVVSYASTGRSRSAFANVVGCFVASDDIDGILRLSEPPPHDEWDPAAQRLTIASESYPDVVESVLKRVKTAFKDFQKRASPPDPFNDRRLTAVERVLAQWFGPSGPGNPRPKPSASPIHLVPDGPKLELTQDGLVASGTIKISLGESAVEQGQSSVPIRFNLTLKVGEEDGVSSADPIQFDLEVERGDIKLDAQASDKPGEKPAWVGNVKKGEPIRVKFKSEPYDPRWTIKMVPVVTDAESEAVE